MDVRLAGVLALLMACAGSTPPSHPPGPDEEASGEGGGDGDDGGSGDAGGSDDGGDTGSDLPDTDHCTEALADFSTGYDTTIATWVEQDGLSTGVPSPVVFTGSSSIRRWEGLAAAYTDFSPVQRGFGGAQVAEVAVWADELVNHHEPRGVVVFAGTNDVAIGVSAEATVARFRCLRERIWTAHGQALPVLFIGITPTPSRWAQWETASAVNEAVAALAEEDEGLVYVDVPAAFLATGSPPEESLFVSDMLHLSESGYALWDSVLRPAVEEAIHASEPASGPSLSAGTRILVDLGPSDGDDGQHTASPDHLDQHWNNWFPLDGGASILPGERLGDLVSVDGTSTVVDLVITGGFSTNGRQNGGLLWPSSDQLGDLAVGTATEDYFYATSDDITGGLMLRELDPSATYTLRLFASRDDDETRLTTYRVTGATTAEATLQTSGAGSGSSGNGNDDDIAELTGVRADPYGHLFIDVELTEGRYAYLSLLELTVE